MPQVERKIKILEAVIEVPTLQVTMWRLGTILIYERRLLPQYISKQLRTVKRALNLLFLTRKYVSIFALVYRNRMAAECRLPSFVIIILTIGLFCIALF